MNLSKPKVARLTGHLLGGERSKSLGGKAVDDKFLRPQLTCTRQGGASEGSFRECDGSWRTEGTAGKVDGRNARAPSLPFTHLLPH